MYSIESGATGELRGLQAGLHIIMSPLHYYGPGNSSSLVYLLRFELLRISASLDQTNSGVCCLVWCWLVWCRNNHNASLGKLNSRLPAVCLSLSLSQSETESNPLTFGETAG